jgi:hypothetical protein
MTPVYCIFVMKRVSTAWGMIIRFGEKMGIWKKAEDAPGLFALRGHDRRALAASLERLALLAPQLTGPERQDLAAQWSRQAVGESDGDLRVAFLAEGSDQLAARARLAADLVSQVRAGPVVSEAGVYLSAAARGRTVLVFPGGDGVPAAEAAALAASMRTLRWLDRCGVTPAAAVGAGLGEVAGLVWAGSLTATEAARLITQHGELRGGAGLARTGPARTGLARVLACYGTATKLAVSCGLFIASYEGPHSHVLGGPAPAVRELARQADALGLDVTVLPAGHALHTPALAPSVAPLRSVLSRVRFGPPRRRLASTITGRVLTGQQDVAALLCAQLTTPIRFREAIGAVADGADLLVLAAPDPALAAAAACTGVPVASVPASGQDPGACTAALFAAGALPASTGRAGSARPTGAVIPLTRPGTGRRPGAGVAGVAGAIGVPGAAGVAEVTNARGRFVQTITMLRPGEELRAEVRLSAQTDPYLADHLADGQPVFPAAMALEAMAQAASALAGRPLRGAQEVTLGALVRLAGGEPARLRLRARVRDHGVETFLHAGSGLQFAECARAVFVEASDAGRGAGPEAGAGGARPADLAEPAEPAAVVEGADLHGTMCFQTGRFRRVAIVAGRPPRSVRAIVRGHDDAPWFEHIPDTAGAHELVLGSPGLNDAALQVAQACVPGRVLRPGGCDSLTVTGAHVQGAVELRVFLISGPAGRPSPGNIEREDYVWDIQGFDGTGRLVIAWAGLRMRDAGPLPSRRGRPASRAPGGQSGPGAPSGPLTAIPGSSPAASAASA